MKTIVISIILVAMMTSCSSNSGVMIYDVPVSGKQIAEDWPVILAKAVPCQLEGCGDADYLLFKVRFPKFYLVFSGAKSENYAPATSYMNVHREIDGKFLDYDLFIWIGPEGYINENELFHLSENIEIPQEDNLIPISDTGLEIPSRKP